MDRPLITCEHGGNRVPAACQRWFTGHEELLQSHRGYDVGAATLARDLARALEAPLYVSTVSRLVIDLNRSVGHPRLYSEATRPLPAAVRRELLERYYLPYRDRIESWIARQVGEGRRVLHLAAHSFTPVLGGEPRNADIGLLYDPARAREVDLCRCWQASLARTAPALQVRRNYPYQGTSDGFTAWLRRRFPSEAYLGIELEVNQRWVLDGGRGWRELRAALIQALRAALAASPPG